MLLQFNCKRPKTRDWRTCSRAEYDKYINDCDKWNATWKAARINNTITINRGFSGANMVVTVFKVDKPANEADGKYYATFGANGTAMLTEKDLRELNQAIEEAKAML